MVACRDTAWKVYFLDMALKKSEIYSTLTKCANKLRSNSGIGAESFKNYVLIILFLKYVSDKVKSGDNTVLEIPDGCYFEDIIALKGKKNIGDSLNKIIEKISEANGLQDIINLSDHDFCDKKLGNAEDSSKLISELIAAFQDDGLDFSHNRAADDDLIGDAYEYLMRNFASLAGKDKGQFYTPTEISRLMALLIGIDKDDRRMVSAYDPTCGSGSLLLRVRAAAKHNVSLDGQDIDPANIELSYMNMVIHGCETPNILQGDTLNSPKHVENGKLQTYDYVVSNPKFSLHNWMLTAKDNDEYGRWNPDMGVPPQQYGDFAFLLHCVKSLKPGGKCAIILPNGVLTRGGEEERLRKWLIEQRLLSGIIAFPANAFYGTSIAGNVLVLENHRVQDGVFFIDASELGYKDADSKIRLREQDIKRVIDVWKRRKDEPHFAHLSTFETTQQEGEDVPMYEIQRNGFNLNMSRYVVPKDKEILQNIDGHLHGGIPAHDIDRLQHYWHICSTLRTALFKTFRDGFFSLTVDKQKISDTIKSEKSFKAQEDVFNNTIKQWCISIKPLMMSVGKENKPKEEIAQWGQNILDTFLKSYSLVDAYDVYDQLLGYYNDTLQDDLFMISRDGWLPRLILPTKKSPKWTDLTCDLLPVSLAVQVLLPDLKNQFDNKTAELANVQEQMETMVDEADGYLDDSIFYQKRNAKNIQLKLERCSARRLTDKETKFLDSLAPYLEKLNKENKQKIAELSKPYSYLFEEGQNITKKVVQKLINNSQNWEYSTEQQLNLWQQYLDLLKKEQSIKKEIKNLDKQLHKEIIRVYSELTEDKARNIIVSEKWLHDITAKVMDEMQTAMHRIVTEVNDMHSRYEFTLGELSQSFCEKENTVFNHLKEMGFEL